MLLVRVARMTTTWTKTEHRDPKQREPIFREADRAITHVRFEDGVATLPEAVTADVLLEETGVLHAFRFQPRAVERPWAMFGLRMGDGDEIELWLRDGRGFFYGTRAQRTRFGTARWASSSPVGAAPARPVRFYGAPRRAEYRLAVLRPGEVTRVIHNAKNDFSAASGRERTYRWNDFVIEPLGRVREIRYGAVTDEWTIPLDRAKTVDLREDLL